MSTSRERIIAGIGETVLDIVFRNNQPQAAVPGGSVFNAMVSLGRTAGKLFPELRLIMASQTGDDAVADIILDFMRKNGLDSSCIQRDPGQSTVSMALLDEHDNARYEFFRDKGLPAFRTPQVGFRADDMLLFGSFFAVSEATGPQTRALVRAAREAGAIIYYDINFRKNHTADRRAFEENIALSDLVRGSDEDIEALFGSADAAAVYRDHIAPLCPNYICTRGAQPAAVFSPGAQLSFPTEPVAQVRSTIGAGDNFNAGFLFAMLREGFTRERLRRISAADWALLVPTAMRFSANVCPSLQNYVDPDFRP
ncbi:MAG: carbohydrate kinase [Bacteroidales bacterium]|nr:carbohydrate kinase [Bacteroidales bacterium]